MWNFLKIENFFIVILRGRQHWFSMHFQSTKFFCSFHSMELNSFLHFYKCEQIFTWMCECHWNYRFRVSCSSKSSVSAKPQKTDVIMDFEYFFRLLFSSPWKNRTNVMLICIDCICHRVGYHIRRVGCFRMTFLCTTSHFFGPMRPN